MSYGYQHPQDHDGVEVKYVLEAGDLVDWDFFEILFLCGLECLPWVDWRRWERYLKKNWPSCQIYFSTQIRTPPIPRPKRAHIWVAHGGLQRLSDVILYAYLSARRADSNGAKDTYLRWTVDERRHLLCADLTRFEMYVTKTAKMLSGLEGKPLIICLYVWNKKVCIHASHAS